MFPSLLITFREVIEAALIVATILGILTKLGHREERKTVWRATGAAALVSILLVGLGSALGLEVRQLYEGNEAIIEGTLMITSAFFITWAVFFLHKHFATYKVRLLQKVKSVVEQEKYHGLFMLVFTAVFREGFEIVLFLTTIYFSARPLPILGGFGLGLLAGLCVSFAFFSATLRLPVYWAFRSSSMLLILFAAGLLARGVGEFSEVGLLPETGRITFGFLPDTAVVVGDMTKAVFGLTRSMDYLQLTLYLAYVWLMHWWVFVRSRYSIPMPAKPN